LFGAFFLLRGLDRAFLSSASGLGPALPHLQGGVLAVLLAGLLVLITEPYMLRPRRRPNSSSPPDQFRSSSLSLKSPPGHRQNFPAMIDTSTLLSSASSPRFRSPCISSA